MYPRIDVKLPTFVTGIDRSTPPEKPERLPFLPPFSPLQFWQLGFLPPPPLPVDAGLLLRRDDTAPPSSGRLELPLLHQPLRAPSPSPRRLSAAVHRPPQALGLPLRCKGRGAPAIHHLPDTPITPSSFARQASPLRELAAAANLSCTTYLSALRGISDNYLHSHSLYS